MIKARSILPLWEFGWGKASLVVGVGVAMLLSLPPRRDKKCSRGAHVGRWNRTQGRPGTFRSLLAVIEPRGAGEQQANGFGSARARAGAGQGGFWVMNADETQAENGYVS